MKSGTVVTVLVVAVLLAAAVYGVATARPKTVPDPNAGLDDEAYIEQVLVCKVSTEPAGLCAVKVVLLYDGPSPRNKDRESVLRLIRMKLSEATRGDHMAAGCADECQSVGSPPNRDSRAAHIVLRSGWPRWGN